jgi:hypothetical protein
MFHLLYSKFYNRRVRRDLHDYIRVNGIEKTPDMSSSSIVSTNDDNNT